MQPAVFSVSHVRIPLRRAIRHASHTRTNTDSLLAWCVLADGTTGYVGGEVSMELGNLRSILRVIYMPEDDSDGTAGSVRLASSTHAMGTQAVNVTSTQAYVEPSLTLAGHDAEAWDWWLNYGARIGSDKGTEHRVTAGFRVLF